MVISYLGDENSYSYAAARKLTDGELRAYPTMAKVIGAAISGECDGAVLPVENNVEGAVNEVYDSLFDSGLYMIKQLVLPVRHSLIAAEGATIEGLERIISHPQAIAQCHNYLLTIPTPVEAVSSTSAALAHATKTTAAIALKPKAGQIVLKRGIQDSSMNATRFALLNKRKSEKGGTVSISFDLDNEPGTLVKVLDIIYRRGVNMTRILSRPHRSGDGSYRFFIDFDFAESAEKLDAFLSELGGKCSAFRFLGRYDLTVADDV